MKRIFNKTFLYPLALILISVFITFQNYTPGTILSGWDTLHPEFNFALNFQRTFSGVFRPGQGLGAVAGHSHMSDLPRIVFLFISSFVLPANFLRYFYMFLMLNIGPLGMYFFLSKVVIKDKTASFLGALFYLLNIGTVQIFFVPFEMFATQYGFLPWLLLFATQYLKSANKQKKYLLLFSLITLLSTPIAYAATLWYVQFAFLLFYILVFGFRNNRKVFHLSLITIVINIFWILPNIYFLINYGSSVLQANINKLFSPQAFLYNKEFGNLKDVFFLKTFLFDWNIYEGYDNFIQLLSVWNSHLANISFLGILFGLLAILGIVLAAVKKNKVLLSLFPGLAICLFFLINENFPTGFIYTFLQKTFPVFKEALRFPDDKVLGLFVFCFSVFFAFGIYGLRKIIPKIARPVISFLIIISLLYFMLPAFQGNLISPSMRIKIPEEYFSMFNWLNKQEDSGKIANLPINSFWGWEYYNWYADLSPSFQGAGFLWFGIKQPLLTRDFDRWNPSNEQYYREMSYAIYSQNSKLISSVIQKYDIHYILLDKNTIAPQNNSNVLFYPQTESLLNTLVQNGTLESPVKFGKIAVYKLKNQQMQEFSTLSSNTANLYEDFAFEKYGNYISSGKTDFNLTDNSSILKNNLFDTTNNAILLKRQAVIDLSLPLYINAEKNISAEVFVQESSGKINVSFYPDTFSTDKATPIIAQIPLPGSDLSKLTLSVNQKDNFSLKDISSKPLSLGKVILSTQEDNTVSVYDDSQSQQVIPDFSNLKYALSPCDQGQNGNTFGIDVSKEGNGFTIFGKDNSICMTIPVSEISKIDPNKSITKDSLVGMTFYYTGEKYPDICGVNLLTGGCIKNISSGTDKIGSQDIGNLGIRIALDIPHISPTSTRFGAILQKTSQQEKATYQNISFTITKPFYSAALDSNILRTSLSIASQKQNKDGLLIPIIKSGEFSKNIEQISQPNNSCPQGPNDIVDKKISADSIEYISKKGSYCDYFTYQNLPQNTAYAIVFTSKNIEGLPFSVCVSNPYSNHCDIYASLPAEKDKKQTIFILPPMSQDKTGFTIDINNFAISGTESINDLYSIQVTPFPYTWLTSLPSGQQLKNKRITIYPYSYDPGWKAYEVKDINFWTENFPFLFGKEIKNHVKVNGWENGWLSGNYTLDVNRYSLIIIFLPQYLEYFGFVLLIGTFAFLIFLTFKPRRM